MPLSELFHDQSHFESRKCHVLNQDIADQDESEEFKA